MRTHEMSDNMDDYNENKTSYDWAPNASKRMYALRNNPNRLKNCRVCESCGIEFSSWKSFLEHGKCNSDSEEGPLRGGYEHNSSKRKRPYRASVGNPSSEEEDLAHCLMMLSNGLVEPFSVSASKDEAITHHEKAKLVIPKGLFECKACKKVFNSHQALGGHRASHKKVKGCFAAKLDHTNHNGLISQMVLDHVKFQYDHNGSSVKKKKAKVHECSICYRVFSSGQALGGHKRCHWITSKHSPDHTSASVANGKVNNLPKDSETLDLTLDLNFHALDAKPHNDQISQEMFLLPWVGSENCEKDYIAKQNIKKIPNHETETMTKSVKLIELKEMTSSQTSSQWLQVGLGSTSTNAGDGI